MAVFWNAIGTWYFVARKLRHQDAYMADVLWHQIYCTERPLSFNLRVPSQAMSAMASQITGVSIVCSIVCSGADQRKHQISVSLAFVRGIHRWPMDCPHKGPITRRMLPPANTRDAGDLRRHRAHYDVDVNFSWPYGDMVNICVNENGWFYETFKSKSGIDI